MDYGLWGGLVNDNLADLPGLAAGGVIGYKAFMSDSGVDFATAHDGILYEGMQFIARTGSVLGVHAENDVITAHLSARLKAAGRTDRRAWAESRPEFQELEAISRVLFLAGQTGARTHVVHVSIAAGVGRVRQAQAAGVPVSCETCAHYLWFDEEDFLRIGPAAKCAPPLRGAAGREALWQRVLAGEVDCIASDHSPAAPELKTRGIDDVWQAWGGITGIQATLPVLLTAGVHRRGLPLPLLARLWAGGAARIFGLAGRKGAIARGADADVVLVDPEAEWTMTADDLRSRHQVSPYVGSRFKGKVVRTLLRGQTVYGAGADPQPGTGRLLLARPGGSHAAG